MFPQCLQAMSGPKRSTISQPRSFRPRLEHLETRQLLSTVAAGPHGEVYATFGPDRELWEMNSTGSWHFIDWNVTAVSVGPDNILDAVFTDGSLWQLNAAQTAWTYLDYRAIQVAAGPNGEVDATFGPDQELWELNATGWHFIDWNVTAVSVGADNTLDAVFTDTSLWQLNPARSDWKWIDHDANQVAAGPNGQVTATFGSDDELWQLDSTGWTFLDWGAAQVSVGADNSLDGVFTDTTLWQLNANGWQYLDVNANTW